MDDTNSKSTPKKLTFEEYYTKYYPKVYAFVLKRIRNPEQSEDLTMEIFSKCCDKFGEFDASRASFGTWVYAVTKNRLKNYYRDKKEFEELDENIEYAGGFEDEIVAAEYINNMRGVLADALETLSDTQRRVIVLKYFKNMNSTETARLTGLSAVNVRVNLSRGIARLKEYFKDHDIDM